MKVAFFIIICIFFLFTKQSCYSSTNEFIELNEEKCSTLRRDDMLKLPLVYQEYLGFVKICSLKKKDSDEKWRTSLISIWAHDYLLSKGDASRWKDFPAPILIDSKFKEVGKLPELYPMDWVTHLLVSYGKWHAGGPGEIRVDISNPAVTGDYYYAPLEWNMEKRKYEMKSQEPITGKRPK